MSLDFFCRPSERRRGVIQKRKTEKTLRKSEALPSLFSHMQGPREPALTMPRLEPALPGLAGVGGSRAECTAPCSCEAAEMNGMGGGTPGGQSPGSHKILASFIAQILHSGRGYMSLVANRGKRCVTFGEIDAQIPRHSCGSVQAIFLALYFPLEPALLHCGKHSLSLPSKSPRFQILPNRHHPVGGKVCVLPVLSLSCPPGQTRNFLSPML